MGTEESCKQYLPSVDLRRVRFGKEAYYFKYYNEDKKSSCFYIFKLRVWHWAKVKKVSLEIKEVYQM